MDSWRISNSRTRVTRAARILTMGGLMAGLALAGAQHPSQPAHAQEAPGGLVRVVHGLRGLIADVYINDQLVLPTFHPRRSTDPLAVPSGDHLVEIRTAGAAKQKRPLLAQTVTVPPGFQGSLVAHLDGAGEPTLSAFPDDLAAVPAGQSRVEVRHTADAEDISVLLNDEPAIAAVAPSAGVATMVPAGEYRLSVTPTAGGTPLASPQGVEYAEGTANHMYLIGSQSDGTLGWAVVRISDLQTAPEMIQTGDGSLDGRSSDRTAPLVLVATGLVAVGTGVFWSRSRRSLR